MAKALFGYVGGPDMRLVDEIRRLRHQVSDLELQVMQLQARCEALAEAVPMHQVSDADVLALTLAGVRLAEVREPAGASR